MYHIDKFFSFELSVVLNATDDEYQKYLASHKQADDDFKKQIEDLDDYFLNDSPQDDEEQAPEDMAVQKQLEKTVKEFERSLTENKYQSREEKQELENVIKTLKSKINDLERKTSVKQITDRGSTIQNLDINELRRRGIQEIFNFYCRQHIPLNRKFEELQACMEEIDLGEFMKFCKDFEIPLSKAKQQEVFKKSSASHKPLKIEQFNIAITRIATEMNKQRLLEVNLKLKQGFQR